MQIKVVLLLLAMGLAACSDRTVPEPIDQSVRPARIFVVQGSAATLKYEFVGRVEAAQSIDMTFEVSGPLVQLPVLEGQSIERGSLVAGLETKDFELAVRESQLELQLARQDLERKQQVLAQKGIARSIVDDARSNYELQRVRLEKARESLADAKLLSPFDAYVTRRYVDNFVNVRAGVKIVKLNDLRQLLIIANVPENLFATVTADQVIALNARFDFAPGEQFPLVLYESRGEADSLAQTYEISFTMDRPEVPNILPGMTASVVVELRSSDTSAQTRLIPTSALVTHPNGGFFVWLFDPETQLVSRREVTVELPHKNGVPVTSGLQGGEMIVATGASQLIEGMQIRVLGEPVSRL
jgi:RND family efflux transporter MFP subunit